MAQRSTGSEFQYIKSFVRSHLTLPDKMDYHKQEHTTLLERINNIFNNNDLSITLPLLFSILILAFRMRLTWKPITYN